MIREIHQERKTQGGEARTQLQSKFTSGKKKPRRALRDRELTVGGRDSISDRGQRQPDIGRLCICWWEIEKKKRLWSEG